MTDNQLRGELLSRAYVKETRGKMVKWNDQDLTGLPEDVTRNDIARACEQLGEYGLFDLPDTGRGRPVFLGYFRLTAAGVDVVEGVAESPISINLDHSQIFKHLSFNRCSGRQ